MLKSLRIFVMVALVLGCVQVRADTEYYTSYDVTLNSGQSDVTNIILLETVNGDAWGGYSTNCGGSGCSTVLNNPFGSTTAPTTTMLIGLTNGGTDLVLMTNTTFGASAVGTDFSTLFPDTTESSLIAAVALTTSGGPFCPGVNCINPPGTEFGLNAVDAFASGDGAAGYFTFGDSFDVLEFSDGVLIGTGTSTYYSSDITATPEPSSLWLFGSGLVGLAGMLRRKICLLT